MSNTNYNKNLSNNLYLKFYFRRDENFESIDFLINNLKEMFSSFIIAFDENERKYSKIDNNNNEDLIKILVAGKIYHKNNIIKKIIKLNLTRIIEKDCLSEIYFYTNNENCMSKILNKISTNELTFYTNINEEKR